VPSEPLDPGRGPAGGAALVEETVCVPARAAHLGAFHEGLGRFWVAVEHRLPRAPDGTWRILFETAVAEVGANVVRHAHPAGAPPGRMCLRLRAFADRIEARISDRGVPFEPGGPPPAARPGGGRPAAAAADALASLPEGGYGLAVARAAVDRLDYARSRDGENAWHLVKRI
jgi:serine/threonine-protein kinase RsbW